MNAETSISDEAVKQEFQRSTIKFMEITFWVGVIVNVVWFASDYFSIPEYFTSFFTFRCSVSAISILVLLMRKQLGFTIPTCLFIFVVGVTIENAYMWSVMDIAHFQKHAFAYIVLFIGLGMLVLWELKFSLLLVAATLLSNIVFYIANSNLTPEEFLTNGAMLTLTVAVFSVFMIRTRYRLTYSEIKNRMELELSKLVIEMKHHEVVQQKVEIQSQKDDLQEKNREITDSINYAKNIQTALIPSEKKFNQIFKNSFVLFKPKDIVSGDFYWAHEKAEFSFYVTADCTGHGVPGGFMTMLGLSFLDDIIARQNITDPAEVLNVMRDKIISTLNQSGNVGENKDGMDITVCRISKNKRELTFASANNSLYVIDKNKEITEYKGDRQPCGFSPVSTPFKAHTITLSEGDCLYTFTDGYADQFGGPRGKKFRYKELEQLLQRNSQLPAAEQKQLLDTVNDEWRGSLEQVDDILIIGVLL